MPELTPQSVAHEALLEITPAESIGAFIGVIDEGDGIVTVQYASALAGYPGWKWTVSVSTLDGLDPSVLETELIPSDGSLLAPDWVPWSDRLADYKAAQAELASAESDDGSDESDEGDESDESDDDDSEDDDDDDDLGSDVLHGGDLDGVDIDDADDDDDSDDDEESEDDDDDFEESDDDDLDEGLREV